MLARTKKGTPTRPRRERALRQLERHAFEVGPALARRRLTPLEQMLDGTATADTDLEPVTTALPQMAPAAGEYLLNTR
ncbi:hypothetical protein ACWCPJ_38990 [Streptomyces collinus]